MDMKTFKTIGPPVKAKRGKAAKPEVAPGSVLENSFVRVDYRRKRADGGGTAAISGDDKTDKNNEPRFFTQNKRGLDAQWTALSDRFNNTTNYRDVLTILRDHGAKVHDYCAMD